MHAAFAIFFCILHNSTFQREGAKHGKNWTFQYISRKILSFCPDFLFVLCPNLENIWWKLANCTTQNCPYFAKTFTVKVSSHRKHIAYITMSNNWKEVREWNLKEVFSLQRGLFLPAQGEMAELKGQQNTITLLSLSGANTVQREFLFQVKA